MYFFTTTIGRTDRYEFLDDQASQESKNKVHSSTTFAKSALINIFFSQIIKIRIQKVLYTKKYA